MNEEKDFQGWTKREKGREQKKWVRERDDDRIKCTITPLFVLSG